MRLAATVCALAVLGFTAAHAQDTPADVPVPAPEPEIQMDPVDLADVAPAELQGADVLDAAGEEFGRITSIVFTSTGEMDSAVISAGGFLGFGRHSVAIPVQELSLSAPPDTPGALIVQIEVTEAEFKEMPEVGAAPVTE